MRVFVTGASGHIGSALIPELRTAGHDIVPADVDLRAINTIGEALAGSDKPFVGTSGTLLLRPGRLGTEEDSAGPAAPAAPRVPAR